MENKFTERQIEIMEAAIKRIDCCGIQELTIKNLAADINLSEAALYRHFKGKNEILLGLLTYFIMGMKERISSALSDKEKSPSEILRLIFTTQLNTFVNNPAIVSVIFSEGIFQFNKELSDKVSAMMKVMQTNIGEVVKRGQEVGVYNSLLGASATTTIIMGSMRMVVLKWKLSGHKSDLIKDGTSVLNGLINLLEK
ncbi:MAG: TetR/AcrR family transcriptional regulator [Flavobacteriales bacterium]|nr:TetR/AcrR family transcriptional regulator [Flavobacteriales bacterium]